MIYVIAELRIRFEMAEKVLAAARKTVAATALPAWHAPSGFPLNRAIVSVCRMLVTVYGDDQAELLRLDAIRKFGRLRDSLGAQTRADAADIYFRQ